MLVGGLRLCEELFGGFKANLQKAGGQDVDWLKDCSVVHCTLKSSPFSPFAAFRVGRQKYLLL